MRASFLGMPYRYLKHGRDRGARLRGDAHRQRLQHVALNVAKLVNMRSDPVLAADVANSDMVGIDGMGIVWAARPLGLPVKARVAGVDLLAGLLAVCAREGFRPYFLGATGAVLQRAVADALREKYPALRFRRAQGRLFQAKEQEADVVAKSATAAPIACSSACRPRARSAFSPPTATR